MKRPLVLDIFKQCIVDALVIVPVIERPRSGKKINVFIAGFIGHNRPFGGFKDHRERSDISPDA
jgi:hypothetical protein